MLHFCPSSLLWFGKAGKMVPKLAPLHARGRTEEEAPGFMASASSVFLEILKRLKELLCLAGLVRKYEMQAASWGSWGGRTRDGADGARSWPQAETAGASSWFNSRPQRSEGDLLHGKPGWGWHLDLLGLPPASASNTPHRPHPHPVSPGCSKAQS